MVGIYSLFQRISYPVEKRYKVAFERLINISKGVFSYKYEAHYVRDYKLSDRCQRLLDDYILFSEQEGNSNETIKNKRLRIKGFMVQSDFDHLNKESVIKYLKEKQKVMRKTAYSIQMRLIKRF